MSAFEIWSELIWYKAVLAVRAERAGVSIPELLGSWALVAFVEAFQTPANWKRVRIPRDAKTRRQAARVTRALRRMA